MAEGRNGVEGIQYWIGLHTWRGSRSMNNVDGREGRGEKSTVNSRDSFVIIHRSIVRMALQLSFLRLSRPFVRSNDQFLFHLHSVFLSPYLFLSLFFFLTVNFDKEPFFFTRKAPYFPLLPVPLPTEHLKEDIWGFRGSRRFVTLTLNLTMDS